VGYFVPVKNLPILIEAFSTVLRKHPGARLKIVGGGETKQQELELTAQVQRMGLGGSVIVMGYRPRQEIARMMREECDVFVLCSRSETFGCVLAEAMSCGVPVVATRCGGPEDIVNDPRLGVLIPPGDPVALADAICGVIERLPEYDREEIRRDAVLRFSYRTITSRLKEQYESALR
jgi:glycosyltransferase involved in cell wall biosynthesis